MALPIAERDRRLAAVRELMATRGIGALLIVGRDSSNERGDHRYLTGYGVAAAFAHHVIVAADPAVEPIVFSGSSPSARVGVARGWVTDLRTNRQPQAEIVCELGRLRGDGHIGITDSVPIPVYRALAAAHGEAAIVDGADCLRLPRLVKSAHELELIRRSAAIADAAYRHLLPLVTPGATDWELYAELKHVLTAARCEYTMDIIECGDGAATVPVGHTIADGDVVHVEITPSTEGYFTQLRVGMPAGRPSWNNGFQRLRDGWSKAYEAAQERLRPGLRACDVYAAAARALESEGLVMGHRAGHGLGLDVDEFLSLDPGDETVLEPGMVIVIHPRVSEAGRHVMMGGTFAVTADGPEPLNQTTFV